MRAIWNGALSFGLVNIPVRLYSASKERALSFKLLDKKEHSPIGYKKVRKSDDTEVEQKDIVKGYEVESGQFVVLEPDDFKKANARKTQTIEIVQFVDRGEIDPLYYDKPYFIEPDKKAVKAYALLRDALEKARKAGVARFVLKDKEHIALVEPYGDVLTLQQLRYQDELRAREDINVPKEKDYNDKEMKLALSLIDTLTEHFEPAKFKDTYTAELMKVIEAKAKGKRITIGKDEVPEATSTADILKALQRSLEEEPEPLSGRKSKGRALKPKAKAKRHAAR